MSTSDNRCHGGDELKELLKEYRESLRLTKEMRENAPEEDQKIYAGMITNLEYAVKWLRDEQQPAPKKVRQILFAKPEYIEILDYPDPFNFNGDPFEEVENRLDAERRKKRVRSS